MSFQCILIAQAALMASPWRAEASCLPNSAINPTGLTDVRLFSRWASLTKEPLTMKDVFVTILFAFCVGNAFAGEDQITCQDWQGRWQGEWQVGGVGKCTLNIKGVDQNCNARIKYCGGGNSASEGQIEGNRLQFECNRSTSGTCTFKMSSDKTELNASYSNPSGGRNYAVFKRKAESSSESVDAQPIAPGGAPQASRP